MAKFSVGDHVLADFGDGAVVAHIAGDEQDGKWPVQKPDGNAVPLSHREPEDRDESGSGGTFWQP